jgi:hypothetical protein
MKPHQAMIGTMTKLYKKLTLAFYVPFYFLISCNNVSQHIILKSKIGKVNSEYNLQVLAGKGDAGANVVNFYVKTSNDEWLWFYVNHESTDREWSLRFKGPSEDSVEIVTKERIVAVYDVRSGKYFLDGQLHSTGEFKLIGSPLDQGYPVSKVRIK